MRVKASNKKAIIVVLVLVIITLVSVRIWYVNQKAYKFATEEYSVGDWISLDGNFFSSRDAENNDGYSLCVSKAEVITYEEFMQRFGKSTDYLAESSRHDVILLTVDVKNEDNEDGGVFIRDMNLFNAWRSTYYCKNNVYMKIANPNLPKTTDGIKVKPGTEATMYMVYATDGAADGITYLEKLEAKGTKNFTMYLNVSRYPILKTIKLNLTMPE